MIRDLRALAFRGCYSAKVLPSEQRFVNIFANNCPWIFGAILDSCYSLLIATPCVPPCIPPYISLSVHPCVNCLSLRVFLPCAVPALDKILL